MFWGGCSKREVIQVLELLYGHSDMSDLSGAFPPERPSSRPRPHACLAHALRQVLVGRAQGVRVIRTLPRGAGRTRSCVTRVMSDRRGLDMSGRAPFPL